MSQGFAKRVYTGGTRRAHMGRSDVHACKTGATALSSLFRLPFFGPLHSLPSSSRITYPRSFSQLLFMAVVFKLSFANDHLGILLKCRFLGSSTRFSDSVSWQGVLGVGEW